MQRWALSLETRVLQKIAIVLRIRMNDVMNGCVLTMKRGGGYSHLHPPMLLKWAHTEV